MNILLIHSDQHRFDCVGANGNALIRTPNLDRLAREGCNFTNAYTPSPLCAPARNCQLFGCMFDHGVISNWYGKARNTWPLNANTELPTYSALLKEAGYDTGYVGKWHVHPVLGPADFGFEDVPVLPEYHAWRAERTSMPAPPSQGYRGGTDPGPPECSRLSQRTEVVLKLLDRYAQGDRPFLLRYDPPEPHPPYVPPDALAAQVDPAEIPPWPGCADSGEGKPFAQTHRTLYEANCRLPQDPDWQQWAPMAARYMAVMTLLDQEIGRILTHLDALGLSDETLVIYTTDHGDLCGSHGGMMDKHLVMYDDVIKVPLIIRAPGSAQHGGVYDGLVSNELDVPVTCLTTAGVDVPDTFEGRDLRPVLAGHGMEEREDIFSYYHRTSMGAYPQRAVRNHEWKYIFNAFDKDELYDIESDPAEAVNLIDNPQHRDALGKLKDRLRAHMAASHDPLLPARH